MAWEHPPVWYDLEYCNKFVVEIQEGDDIPKHARVLIVDDILDAGGIIVGAMNLIQKFGAKCV